MTDVVKLQPEAVWAGFLEAVRPTLSTHVLETWLRPVRCLSVEDGVVRLEVRDQFFRDWLTDHYLDFIRDGLTRQAGVPVVIEWLVNPEAHPEEAAEEEPIETPHTPTVTESLDQCQDGKALNPRYVFDNFVSGPSNQFAFAACKAVAEHPGTSYNPLFIFGGVGLGKTHLLSAIGHRILQERPTAHVVYASSEQFTNEVINAVLTSKLEDFRSKYRRHCDVLLIDDIQLIAGKERTQNEFFHIFNTLYDSQRQIVVTSDKLPHEIPEIEDRLRSRFQWGLIADVQPPEIETRIAIVRKKAISEGTNLADEVAFFLAKSIRSNVRELEGALVRLIAHASLTGSAMTVEYARHVLADLVNTRPTNISVEAVQKVVATFYEVKVADLKSRRRLKGLVRARQVAMFLARKHTGLSFPALGSVFGDKDHTTIMSACGKVDELVRHDAAMRQELDEIEQQLELLCD